ncbi:hypothetical protein AB4K20DRAFT_1916270 [Rhizopus microsporus]
MQLCHYGDQCRPALIPSSYLNEHLLHYQLYPLVIEPVKEVSSKTEIGASRETIPESSLLYKCPKCWLHF